MAFLAGNLSITTRNTAHLFLHTSKPTQYNPDVLAFTRSASHNLWYQYAVARVVAVVAVRTIPSRQSGNASYAVNAPAESHCTRTGVVINKIRVVSRSSTSFAYKPVFYKTIVRSNFDVCQCSQPRAGTILARNTPPRLTTVRNSQQSTEVTCAGVLSTTYSWYSQQLVLLPTTREQH
jgi:hypothetical protein